MQYITELKAKDDFKNIKRDFEWKNIPKFAVITGENGSGKSTLLQGIQNGKFIINNHQQLQAVIETHSSFKLNGNGYSSNFVKEVNHEELLLSKHTLETDKTNVSNIFNRMLLEIQKYTPLIPIALALTFEDFILKNFLLFDQNQQDFLNNWRNALNLDSYHKHFERNGMSEEKFYLSTHDEIKQWFSNLEDKNFTSRKTIFDENALTSIFGDYYIRKSNKRDDIEENYPNLTISERDNLIEKEIGINPLVKINQLLEQVYSKYTLSMRHDNNNQPKIICKDSKGVSISLNELSTGEQIIISLYMWQYDKNPLHSMILLLDEPDAHLNPKMAKNLIDILKNVIVNDFKCQVIMTTHSLSTVAQCEDGDLFFMEDGNIWESSREEAIEMLAQGISLDSFWENIETLLNSPKILFVEGKTDKKHIEKYFALIHESMPFKIIDCKSADKMPFYADMIKALKGNIADKCIFMFDNDTKGQQKKHEIEKKGFKTMFVSQGQKYDGKDFTIENCYDSSIVTAHNPKATTSWSNEHKVSFSKRKFKLEEVEGIGILINEIKKELNIP